MRRFLLRLLHVIRRSKVEEELAREISAHLALLEDEFQRRGMTVEEAHRAARISIGGIEKTKELHREARSFTWLEDAQRDFWHSARLLRRNPIFTLTAALSLAIGIGATTAIFTLANALLFRDPVGVADPARLVDIGVSRGDGGLNPASYPTYLDIRHRVAAFSGVFAHELFPQAMSLGAPANSAGAERVFGQFVSTNFFAVLGAVPLSGRLFGAGDGDQPGASPIAVLSQSFWARHFSKDPSVVGRTVQLNRQPFTIVGVAPEGFQGTGIVAGDFWLPLNMIATASSRESILANRGSGWLVLGGRLKPGVSMAQAADELQTLGRALDREYPSPTGARGLGLLPSSLVPGNSRIVATFVAVLMVIVALVLAVACANVAGMLMARATTRRREIAVRSAIGAGRARLVRQLLTEASVLFVLGGAVGLMLAHLVTSLVVPMLPSIPVPIALSLPLDGRVIAFTTCLSFAAALLFGLAPALQTAKVDVLDALKDVPPVRGGESRLRSAFVIAQIAFSLLLVVTAGLFVRALRHAGSMDPGFEPRGVELASLDLTMAGYTERSGLRFWSELMDRLRQLPGVETATLARVLPGGFEGIGLGGVEVPDVTPPDGQRFFSPSWNIVERGYFATLRIPLIAGRDFDTRDTAGAPAVAIVGEGVARRFWPGEGAVGRYLWQQWSGPGASPNGTRPMLVVGVARDVKSSSLIDGLARSFVYLPLHQHPETTSTMTIAVRAADGQRIGGELRAVVASMNPNLAIVRSQTLEDSTALGLVPQRVVATLSGSLGMIGLALAAIGIYGVTAFTVARRTREIGIRVALGARRGDIVGMVLRQGLVLTTVGCAIGLTLAAAASQALAGFLFGIPPIDPPAFIGATLAVVGIGSTAAYVPARRATSIDPLTALRRD